MMSVQIVIGMHWCRADGSRDTEAEDKDNYRHLMTQLKKELRTKWVSLSYTVCM